jgi:hypothetical protein
MRLVCPQENTTGTVIVSTVVGKFPVRVEGEQFNERPGLVVTAAADFLHDPGDSVADPGWVPVFVRASGWAWRWWDLGIGGEIGLVARRKTARPPRGRRAVRPGQG